MCIFQLAYMHDTYIYFGFISYFQPLKIDLLKDMSKKKLDLLPVASTTTLTVRATVPPYSFQ
jgi:hypothetical protein